MSDETKGMILLVDDTETNIDILMEALSDEFEISVAMDGETALEIVEELNPDLILLDIMMPGIDGYEVCRRLKSNRTTADIPIVFLTAMTESEDEAKGLKLGAVDYVTKPFNPELVKARVRNHLSMRRTQIELIEQRDKIEDDYKQIKELEHLRDELVHMMVHDMRTPLMGISSYLSMILAFDQDKLEDETKEYIIESLNSTEMLNGMVTALLDVSRLESGQMPLNKEKCNLVNIADSAVKRLGGLLQGRNFIFDSRISIPEMECDPVIIERVISNIIANAVKFTPSRGIIRLELKAEKKWNTIIITDNGPGIPPEYHNRIFEKFGQVQARKENKKFSTGLGLTFCKLAVDAHGGSIQVTSEPGEGTSFIIRLPISDIPVNASIKKQQTAEDSTGAEAQEPPVTVLIVNESKMATESIKRYLDARVDWRIIELNNPERLATRLRKIVADLIILDIESSETPAQKIADSIKNLALSPEPAIIISSGKISPEEFEAAGEGSQTGKYPVIPKGSTLAQFYKIISEILN